MEAIDKRITRFIQKHHIFTLATAAGNVPYTCTCFYVYIEANNQLVFTSAHDTRHAREMMEQPAVAGAIALETLIIGRIQGIQFTGIARELKGEAYDEAWKAYVKKFPVALMQDLVLWAVDVDYLKMTHNQLGFGKKLVWWKTNEMS